MDSLDSVEACLAVIGVRPIVSKAVERFTMSKWHEMDALPRRIHDAARSLVSGTMSTKIPLGSFNYRATLEDLSQPFDEQQLIDMASKFPPQMHEVTSGFLLKAKAVRAALLAILPISERKTLSGSSVVPPSQMLLRRFVSTLTVLDDPMRVFPLMAAGAILNTQTISVRTIFPSISKVIDEALQESIEIEKGRKKSFELPPRAEIGVSSWLGRPQVDRKLHVALQGALADAQQAQDNKPAPSEAGTSVTAKEALSGAQRAAYPHAAPGGPA
jgi:hypothetical protein